MERNVFCFTKFPSESNWYMNHMDSRPLFNIKEAIWLQKYGVQEKFEVIVFTVTDEG